MSFSPTPSPDLLREMFPEEASNMEAMVIKNSLKKLKFKYTAHKSKDALIIDIPLTQDHLLQIVPVDRGPGGLPEFFTFVPRPKQSTRRVPFQKPEFEIVETVRVHIAFFDIKDGKIGRAHV